MNAIAVIIVIGLLIIVYRFGRRVSEEEIEILHNTAIKQAGQIELLEKELLRMQMSEAQFSNKSNAKTIQSDTEFGGRKHRHYID